MLGIRCLQTKKYFTKSVTFFDYMLKYSEHLGW